MATNPVTPPLVDVIAGALVEHTSRIEEHGTERPDGRHDWNDQLVCSCGEWPDNAEAHAAHQARAVLAAIETVGGVEWGVENGHTPIDHVDEVYDHDEADDIASDRRGIGIPARAVSRIVGPWTEVAG